MSLQQVFLGYNLSLHLGEFCKSRKFQLQDNMIPDLSIKRIILVCCEKATFKHEL